MLPLPETWHESQRVPDAIARHIAACDPSTILALLSRLEAAETLAAARAEAVALAADVARERALTLEEAKRRLRECR